MDKLILPYPDFQMGELIDPEQHDTNNLYIEGKINELIDLINKITQSVEDGDSGANQIAISPISSYNSSNVQDILEELINRLTTIINGIGGSDYISSVAITGVNGNTVKTQLISLKNLIDAEKTRITNLTTTVNNQTTAINTLSTNTTNSINALSNRLTTHRHDDLYMTRAELAPYLQGGDTIVHVDVFTIVSSNNGDGTFTYSDRYNNIHTGTIGSSGEQIFTLSAEYSRNLNHIKAIINDTLQRSFASGGLIEIDSNRIGLTYPEGNGSEITIEYYQRLGVAGEHSISYGSNVPPPSSGSIMWFKVVV